MRYRSLFTMSDIKGFLSAARSREREREKQRLIEAQGSNVKELSPTQSLASVSFDIETRIAKISILQTQQYRTIEKYVTQNYVKYPIYSPWKKKSKVIIKTLKLTNEELEKLSVNVDPLIRKFAFEIIAEIDQENLFPSWFIREMLNKEHEEKKNSICKRFDDFYREKQAEIKKLNDQKKLDTDKKSPHLIDLSKQKKKERKILSQIDKIENGKKSIFLCIVTFGVYALSFSKKRIEKLKSKLNEIQSKISQTEETILVIESQICSHKNKIEEIQALIKKKNYEVRKNLLEENKKLVAELEEVLPLPTQPTTDQNYISLLNFNGLSYTKIIGCYIIRNVQKDKYYIGQSKDVMKRIRQHFRGTVPNNIVFAEDYYSADQEIRDSLFEVKIIPCETKDELDRTEKELIERYDSFNRGYNGTNGNS